MQMKTSRLYNRYLKDEGEDDTASNPNYFLNPGQIKCLKFGMCVYIYIHTHTDK